MAGKSVAKKGDVKAKAGSTYFSPATEGDWTPGEVKQSTYSQLKTDGAEVVYEATCTFSFDGKQQTNTGKVPVKGKSDRKLSAKTTLLQHGQQKVLLDGDEDKDSYGNKLYVSTSNKLKSG